MKIMNILIPIAITLHFIFDWILQPRHIAKKKGNSDEGIDYVLQHMLINILPFSIALLILLYIFDYKEENILAILLINGVTHFVIDVILPKGNNERQMINWTALDQILHLSILTILILTYK